MVDIEELKRRIGPSRRGIVHLLGEGIGRIPVRILRYVLASKLLGMTISPSAQLYRWREVRAGRNISIGDGSIIGLWATLDGREGIRIGRNVNLSSEVSLWTLQHDPQSPHFGVKGGPIEISDYAWISYRATILPGVSIGEGAVVAAGAIVAHDVDPYAIVGGIPARKIGERVRGLTYSWPDADAPAAWFI